MAENQDNSTKSDEQKLAELEQQLKDKPAENKSNEGAAANTKPITQPAAAADSSKKVTPTTKPVAAQSSKKVTPPAKSFTAPAGNSSAPEKTQIQAGKKVKTGLLWLITLINLIFLLLLIAAAYWGWQQWQAQQQVQLHDQQQQKQQQQLLQQEQASFFSSQQKIIEQSVAASQFAKDDLERQDKALQSNIESLQEQIEITAQQADANKRTMSELTGKRPSDWLIAEADYLVRMAGRKLWLEHDEKTAIFMLQSADSRLQDLDDPSLLPIRQQLAVDIQTVQQINSVSYSSIALSISGLIPQVDSLTLAFFKRPEYDEPVGEISQSVDDWRANLSNSIKKAMKNFFSYKKISVEVKPFMSEQQQWLSKEQLKFTLMTAQIAILKEDAALFQTSLQSALNILAEHFDTQNEAVSQFSNSLAGLLNADVQRVYPDRFLVTNPLKDLIDDRLNGRFTNGDQ
ncbi:MAG: uroporphyrin-3 C-methyltransferase [Paraglaciecola sp.]|jgi:uroporphyrin-3 C-methyltransferase